jgi:hypothetical protein
MNKLRIISTSLILIILISIANLLHAQNAGPSDVNKDPPASAASVDKLLCSSQAISISGPQDVNNTDFAVYHWYKIDASGNKQLTTITTKTYTETPTTAGYYDYVLVTENAGGCTSAASDVFQVFVLPQLTASITTVNNNICTGIGSTVLTATITAATGLALNYQWTRNGINIPGATSSTYTVAGENTAVTITFGLNVNYALSPSCTVSTTKELNIIPLATKPLITAN